MKFLFLRILVPLILFLILRSVLKALFSSSGTAPERVHREPPVPAGGELKKDPVCGTYVPALASVQEKVGGELVYFCSEDCRQKYRR
jgi:YHS domain-containing protein